MPEDWTLQMVVKSDRYEYGKFAIMDPAVKVDDAPL
jgi:hypothetical protein